MVILRVTDLYYLEAVAMQMDGVSCGATHRAKDELYYVTEGHVDDVCARAERGVW